MTAAAGGRFAYPHITGNVSPTGMTASSQMADFPGSKNVEESVRMRKMLHSQETLRRENLELKRKLQLLASTINDEEKLSKVLKCLVEKKKAQLG